VEHQDEVLTEKQQCQPSIVVMGGGTGISNVLWGLKKYTSELVSIVAVTDSGGSSGRLRDELGQLPPGDLRQCLVALSPDEVTAITLRRLFNYRFQKGGLEGHSFGNLFLSALMAITGDVNRAVYEAGRMLGIRGRVLPVSLTDTDLYARLVDGTVIARESNIDVRQERPEIPIDSVYLDPPAVANEPTVEAILSADAIVIGPGDLYTSLIPNLLVDGIPDAIAASPARKIYICNLMTKRSETDGFSASQFIAEVIQYLGKPDVLDCALINTGKFPPELVETYKAEGASPVVADIDECSQLVPIVMQRSLAMTGCVLRHDPVRVAEAIMEAIDAPTGAPPTLGE
jgi:uncharacterized cofD-like protein